MANEITEQIRAAVWNDPQPAMNVTRHAGEWRRRNNAWEWQRGQVRLTRTASGNIYLHGNTGSGMAGVDTALFDYLANEWNTDTGETTRRLCDLYGIKLELTQEQRDKYRRGKVAAAVAPVLIRAAQSQDNAQSQGVQYMNGRGFPAQNGAFGLLTTQSINEAKNAVLTANLEGVTAETLDADFVALGLTEKQAAERPVVFPNTIDGNTNGFVFRRIDGQKEHKYDVSKGLERGAWCDRLTDGGRVVVVEGIPDALRLRSLGAGDVVAFGGAAPNDKLLEVLRRHHKTDVVYIPDIEYKDGKRRTDLERRAVDKLRTMSDPETGYAVASVRVARLPIPEGMDTQNGKQDADSWGANRTAQDVQNLLNGAQYWFFHALHDLEAEAYAAQDNGGIVDGAQIMNRAREIYAGVSDPMQRGLFRRYVEDENTRGFYGVLGIDTHTLEQLDDLNRNAAFRKDMQDGAEKLAKATESGDPDRMAAAVANLNETLNRGRGTRDEWEAQLSQDWDSVAGMVANQPEPIKTKWVLGRDTADEYGTSWTKYGQVELWADDITVFCAPTSHGKTMILFQTLLDLVREDIAAGRVRRYLFVSREEQPRQLALRALKVWIDRKTLKNKSEYSNHADKRAALRDTLRGVCPYGYNDAEFGALKSAIEYYKNNVFPRVALVHTDGSAESITGNIDYYKTQFERAGFEFGGVFVDYFQLLNSDTPNRMRNYELKTICDALKQAAGRSGVPFVIAAQLNREVLRDGVDNVTMSNIGEGADIERIAHDVYMMYQTDKLHTKTYFSRTDAGKQKTTQNFGARAQRMCIKDQAGEYAPRKGFIYIERLKAREGVTGLWALLPYDGESGQIDANGTTETSTAGCTQVVPDDETNDNLPW